jgi:four helix bundle protein
MHSRPIQHCAAFQRLDVYSVSRAVAERVQRATISDAELRDQARRASKSAFLNLCEGLPSWSAPMRRKFFDCAHGSVCELIGAIDLAHAIGAIDADAARAILDDANRLRAMVRALRR